MPKPDAKPLVSCRDVVKIYGRGVAEVHALTGINLEVYGGDLTMLVGPSGCGKTTLLSIVAGILQPTSGTVSALGQDITRMSGWRRTPFRRDNVGFVFQQFNLLPALSAAENVAVPLVIQGQSKFKAVKAATAILGKMGMADRVNSLPGKLSGGQQQRVAIARALVHHPHLLVCDEPTSALDAKTGHTILELLKSIAVEGDRAVIIVTHDPRIFEFADTIARMDDGRIVSLQRRDEFEKSRYGERALAH